MRLSQEPSMTKYDGVMGLVHSVESFGTVDGPGIRYVVFMQGCPMRCLYCHNPDTWKIGAGKEMSAQQIISEYKNNSAFYEKGGITVTGGEPLLQLDFLIDLFKKAKEEKIHTCIDTSGIVFDENNTKKMDELIDLTDLVMLDIKHIDPDKHKKLTGMDNKNILAFAKYLDSKNIPIWIRHTVVENVTDAPEDLIRLGEFIGGLKNLQAIDVLPYHTMGVSKYKELGIKYPLEGILPLSVEAASKAKQFVLMGIKKKRAASHYN